MYTLAEWFELLKNPSFVTHILVPNMIVLVGFLAYGLKKVRDHEKHKQKLFQESMRMGATDEPRFVHSLTEDEHQFLSHLELTAFADYGSIALLITIVGIIFAFLGYKFGNESNKMEAYVIALFCGITPAPLWFYIVNLGWHFYIDRRNAVLRIKGPVLFEGLLNSPVSKPSQSGLMNATIIMRGQKLTLYFFLDNSKNTPQLQNIGQRLSYIKNKDMITVEYTSKSKTILAIQPG